MSITSFRWYTLRCNTCQATLDGRSAERVAASAERRDWVRLDVHVWRCTHCISRWGTAT